VTNDCATTTIGQFLLRRLKEAGVEHALGVPADFNLQLCSRLRTGTISSESAPAMSSTLPTPPTAMPA
jgi:hypothetical protein